MEVTVKKKTDSDNAVVPGAVAVPVVKIEVSGGQEHKLDEA